MIHGIADLQAMAIDENELVDTQKLDTQPSLAMSGSDGGRSRGGGSRQGGSEGSGPSYGAAAATLPPPPWERAAARESVQFPTRLEAPLSPGSNLMPDLRDSQDSFQAKPCDDIVAEYEGRGGSPLRLRTAKIALLQAAEAERRRQAAANPYRGRLFTASAPGNMQEPEGSFSFSSNLFKPGGCSHTLLTALYC